MPPAHKRARPKKPVAKFADRHFIPPVLSIRLDGWNDVDGLVAPRTMYVLSHEFWRPTVMWIEITEPNVSFLIRGVQADVQAGRKGFTRNRRGDGNDDNDEGENEDGEEARSSNAVENGEDAGAGDVADEMP